MDPQEEPDVVLRPAWHDDLLVVAEIYLQARAAAMPEMPPIAHTPDEARRWVGSWNLAAQEVYVAEVQSKPNGSRIVGFANGSRIVGFANVENSWLNGLYVAPSHQGGGIGTALLDLVKGIRPDGFGLWVFESNHPARRFYARQGFVEYERTDGSDNEEKAPDIHLEWPGATV